MGKTSGKITQRCCVFVVVDGFHGTVVLCIEGWQFAKKRVTVEAHNR